MDLNSFSLQNKLALITGGGTGIGFGIARAFIGAGARIIISGRRKDVLVRAVDLLGENSAYVVNDVTDLTQLPVIVRQIEEKHGSIDILINNAGIHLKKYIQDTTDEDFLKVINTNLLGVFSLTRICAENMLKRRMGCIVMISSMSAYYGMDKVVAYSTSKSALKGLINAMVSEYSGFNVRVNAIAPGWIETDMLKNALKGDPQRTKKIKSRIAMEHLGTPEDIGNAAVFLCSDAARYITGVILKVDGGASVYF